MFCLSVAFAALEVRPGRVMGEGEIARPAPPEEEEEGWREEKSSGVSGFAGGRAAA